jgi:hypothetical protein
MKECNSCKKIKDLSCFSKDSHAPDDLKYSCKDCSSITTKKYKEENEKHVKEYNAKYREENKEKIQSYSKVSEEEKENKILEKNKKYYLIFKELITNKGGECIANENEYDGARKPMVIKCKNNHEFKISLNNLQKNRWCPICKIRANELVTLFALEYLFDKPFIKIRPEWLKNKDGNNLEIDCYNEELKLCIEYNGKQHYEFVPFFHKSTADFEKIKNSDKIKEEKCIKKGLIFIKIPYTVKTENICKYIAEKCKENKIEIDESKINLFDIKSLNIYEKKTDELKKLIESKKGKLIEGNYVTQHSMITIQCHKGHSWSTKAKYLKNNAWCHECGHEVNDERKENISEGMTKFLQTEEGKLSKKISHEKRSETMAQQRDEIRANITEKKCGNKECGLTKAVSEFGKKSDTKDGCQSYCKDCVKKAKQKSKQKVIIKANIKNALIDK